MTTQTAPPSEQTADMRSVHTSNLPLLFEQLQISLNVSTYQAGKAIIIRNDNSTLNTHFRRYQIPRGMRFPELLEWSDEHLGNSYVLPDEALAEVALADHPYPNLPPSRGQEPDKENSPQTL